MPERHVCFHFVLFFMIYWYSDPSITLSFIVLHMHLCKEKVQHSFYTIAVGCRFLPSSITYPSPVTSLHPYVPQREWNNYFVIVQNTTKMLLSGPRVRGSTAAAHHCWICTLTPRSSHALVLLYHGWWWVWREDHGWPCIPRLVSWLKIREIRWNPVLCNYCIDFCNFIICATVIMSQFLSEYHYLLNRMLNLCHDLIYKDDGEFYLQCNLIEESYLATLRDFQIGPLCISVRS